MAQEKEQPLKIDRSGSKAKKERAERAEREAREERFISSDPKKPFG
ncbi:hypothetical protein [Floridanema evergladense]|uniref:Small EDRK-rich factor-like N-terminal domain-containing protein n=1 Tax=Floridaenema evergladense BLCC-F167 TaxID=3153639 RepID=A0ABV4WD22_9CYAN